MLSISVNNKKKQQDINRLSYYAPAITGARHISVADMDAG